MNLFNICCFSPNAETEAAEQIASCFEKLNLHLKKCEFPKSAAIKQTYFVNVTTEKELTDLECLIKKQSDSFFGTFVPLSVIPQPSTNKHLVTVEYTLSNSSENDRILTKEVNGIKYLEIKSAAGTFIIASNLKSNNTSKDIYNESTIAFEQMNLILNNENIDFADIVRQWNYIEKIIDSSNSSQHYQIFNDVRSLYYSKYNFVNGYPAATGIGMETGGIIIDFIALKKNESAQIAAIKSQVQTDAHQYTKNVLAENQLPISTVKTTPKFERAKSITTKNGGILYISGTAAIKGELSASNYNAAQQTLMTLDNIKCLYSKENLNHYNIEEFTATPMAYRVYIKDLKDAETIENIVKEYINTTPVTYVKADICRDELLVEIEAVISLTPKY